MTAVKIFDSLPPVDKREILRYAGVRENTSEYDGIIDGLVSDMEKNFTFRVCYDTFDISIDNGMVNLGFAEIKSQSLEKRLTGCEKIVLFAATVGFAPDIEISKNRLRPTYSLFAQAIGAERIEALCDEFCLYVSNGNNDYVTLPRFSPGYGDVPLEMQTEIFDTLKCEKNIGVTLNGSLLMSPSKSVTAIIGLKKKQVAKDG